MSRAANRTGIEELVAIAFAALAALGIALVQPGLAAVVRNVKSRDDVSALPPPKQLKALTVGYRHAAVDLLWAKLLVEWGTAHQEKRAFPDLPRYIDGILEIEPDFATIYDFLDTLIVYGPTRATADDARLARRYLEFGTKQRPYDADVWLHYGQFIAFLAPSFLTDKNEIEQWRKEGAFALMRAVELGSDPDRSLSADTILAKAGEKKAVLKHLHRQYALSDDPDTRRNILGKIAQLSDSPAGEEAVDKVEREWRERYGFLSRNAVLLIGPARVASACANVGSTDTKACPRDWNVAVGEP